MADQPLERPIDLLDLAPSPNGTKPAGRTSRAQWVYETLRAAIHRHHFTHGDRIREEDVARSLGVSRTPVREALSRLQSRGLLEMAPGGLVIAALARPQIMELYAMREILEGSAARFAALKASQAEIDSLYRIHEAFDRARESAPRMAQVNRDFHQGIYEAGHNRYLMRTLDELHDALTLLPSTTFTVTGRPVTALAEHGAILDAINARDADRAESLARDHIAHALKARLELMFSYA
ncbi:GntR family transcriptional regulator [Fodinicurvata sp. EGI_FJ10296]|uniref:GntR family transcriptional regulator n=1 Tax=Fodinicurvata sp. EGI_FJ10296 TaxID=3231908 RepID=UPI003456271D